LPHTAAAAAAAAAAEAKHKPVAHEVKDMASNGAVTIDVLNNRVTGLEHGFTEMRGAISNLDSRIADKFESLASLVNQKSQTNWSLLVSLAGLMFVVTSGLGFLSLQPLKDAITSLADAQKATVATVVPRVEHERNWIEINRRFEAQAASQRVDKENLQRQIDEISKRYDDIYGVKDIIRDILERQRLLEGRRGWNAATEQRAPGS
jgi:hypothetical protein